MKALGFSTSSVRCAVTTTALTCPAESYSHRTDIYKVYVRESIFEAGENIYKPSRLFVLYMFYVLRITAPFFGLHFL